MLKKIISAILLVAVLSTLSLSLFSCKDKGGNGDGGNNQTANGYTVTVVDQNGAPVSGAKITLTTADGIPFFVVTDAQGKATKDGNFDGLTATLTYIPANYTSDKLDTATPFGSDKTLTITVNQLPPYVIKVVDQNGNAVAGVTVSMCDSDGICKTPIETDEEGKAYYPYQPGEFHAQLPDGAPDGYTDPNPGQSYDFVDGEVVITINKN